MSNSRWSFFLWNVLLRQVADIMLRVALNQCWCQTEASDLSGLGFSSVPSVPSDGGECFNQTESLMWEQRRRQIINFTKLSLHLMISIFTIFVCSINTLNHLVCVIHCKFFQAQHWFLTISYDKNLLSLDCVVLISNHILW